MAEVVRVLVVEDNLADVELIKEYLPGMRPVRFQVESVPRLSEALARLKEKAFDLLLIDLGLPDSQGIDTFLKLQKAAPETAAIILTGNNDEETAVIAVRNGAQDYLIKGEINGSVLIRVARYAVERKRAEDTLRSERKMLARTEGIAHIGSWTWDIAVDKVTWSDELFRIFQRDPREGAPSFAEHPALYHPDDMAHLGQAVEAAVAQGTPYELELRAVRKDGATRVCLARGVAETSPEGRVVRLFGSLQDITERKRAEEALKDSERQYRLLADNVQDVIFVLDMNLNYTYISPSIKTLRGFEPEELMRQSSIEMLTPASRDLAMRTFSEIMALEKSGSGEISISRTLELEIERRDGTTVWTEVQFSTIRDENQRLVGITGVTRDITERRRVFERIRKALGATVQAIAVTVASRDRYTAGHQRRVAELARAMAGEMNLPADQIEGIGMAAAIHDIGKISIPAEILSKPTKLTAIEFMLIQAHSQVGYDILNDIEFPWPVARIILEHHERMNGSGYPNSLTGDHILMESRILAVADVIEAMASHRPYRASLGIDAALEEIENGRGVLYDSAVVAACLALFREKRYVLKD